MIFLCILIGIFSTRFECSESMEAVVQRPVTVVGDEPYASTPGSVPLRTRVVVVHSNMIPVPIECFQPPDSGTCSKDLARIYYDHETRTCKPFSYTGCGGNANRFQSIKNCYRICHPYRYKIRPKIASKRPAFARKGGAMAGSRGGGIGRPMTPAPCDGPGQNYGMVWPIVQKRIINGRQEERVVGQSAGVPDNRGALDSSNTNS